MLALVELREIITENVPGRPISWCVMRQAISAFEPARRYLTPLWRVFSWPYPPLKMSVDEAHPAVTLHIEKPR